MLETVFLHRGHQGTVIPRRRIRILQRVLPYDQPPQRNYLFQVKWYRRQGELLYQGSESQLPVLRKRKNRKIP